MKVFARHFRGFSDIEIDLSQILFLVGNNSSGKSSILHLVEAICADGLDSVPTISEEFGALRYDYFSPYFDNSDVEFGFLGTSDPKQIIGKVITVTKGEEDVPKIIRCTYWFPGLSITTKVVRGTIHYRVVAAPEELDPSGLLKLHRRPGKFDSQTEIDPSEISSGQTIFILLSKEGEDRREFQRAVWSININPCRVSSPLRALPTRFYENRRKFDSSGSHFARVWLDLENKEFDAAAYINTFGQSSELFERLHVEALTDKVSDPPLFVTIERGGRQWSLNQVGLGISQIVPILMDSIFSLKIDNKPLLVQQPELHLHPQAQAAFGSYIYRMSQEALFAIFETHSSFIIDRFRADWRETLKNKKRTRERVPAEVIFCESTQSGNVAHHVEILNDGTLKGEPDSYHEFFVDELVRTIF